MEALLVGIFFLFPWFPESGGGDSQFGYVIFMIHLPFMWVPASLFHVEFIPLVLISVVLAACTWGILFYGAHGLWKLLHQS